MFCVAVLAAEGLARLRDEPRLRLRVLGASALLLAAVGLCAAFRRHWREALREDAAWALACSLPARCGRSSRAPMRAGALAVPSCSPTSPSSAVIPEVGLAAGEGHALKASPAPSPQRRSRAAWPRFSTGRSNNATTRGLEGVTRLRPYADSARAAAVRAS